MVHFPKKKLWVLFLGDVLVQKQKPSPLLNINHCLDIPLTTGGIEGWKMHFKEMSK